MGFAKPWAAGHAIQMPRVRPFCCYDFSAKKSIHGSLVLGWGLDARPSISWGRSRRNLGLCCRCSGESSNSNSNCTSSSSSSSSSIEWDWNRWSRHFAEIEQAESYASVLKFQLEDAIEKEDFQEAAKLKRAIAEATLKDTVAEIMSHLKTAIEEERYHDASKLSRHTGSGLLGWWVGYSNEPDDPFGRLIRITPGVGRFIAKSYSPRQLVTATPGTPLFEMFVVKDAEERYNIQVVYLQRPRKASAVPSSSPPKPTQGPSASSTSEVDNESVIDIQENERKTEKGEEKGITIDGVTEEGMKSVIGFLKDKIPGLKVKVMNVNEPEEVVEEKDSVKQLMQEDDEKSGLSDSSEDEIDNLDEIQPEAVAVGEGSDDIEDEKDLDVKLYIGGVVHNSEETSSKDEFTRLPAEIKDLDRDSFVLHIPGKSLDVDASESKISKIKIAELAAQGVAELMPSDIANALWGSDKVSSKASKSAREMIKHLIGQALKRSGLSEYTNFSRIMTSGGDLDPFDGLYVGAFGPYGTEVVQLKRKFGHWNDTDDEAASSEMGFFEYVEAVKLTGGLNVPAGQVIFRAKIGKGNRISKRGMFPDELGVVASYKGHGRIAEYGFRNPKWVDGELLQLNRKGIGPYVKGADLGFLYVVPEQSFLVLFNRLKLPE